MRYCFRHTDALWRVSFWALVTIFVMMTIWIIASGRNYRPTEVPYAPMSQTVILPSSSPEFPGELARRTT